ncbi:MAG: DrmB family protein, partial [Candidatus Cloacimonetes bacterium]|nr:DrmB family protein [Candidatus Cloacimonadota bacterium]
MNKKIFNQNRIGEIRPNQLITTFGPGAIHDAVKDSVTILDINYWGDEGKRINDGRLASYFGVNHFRSPKTSDGNDLPVVSFPYYHVCSNVKCNNLFDIRKKIDIPTYNKQGPTCPICGHQAYPSRFVVACNEGHLDDFPWNWWVHRGKNNCNGNLKLYSTGWTSTLGEIIVECSCGAKRSMAGSTDKDEFGNNGYKCTGHHPHRPKARNETCNSSEIYPSQRGASNIYFPVIRSAISIPPWTNPLYTLLDDHYVRIIDYRRDFGEEGVSKVFNNYFSEKYTRTEFDRALKVREEKIKEFIEIKEMEYKAFVNHNELEYKKDYKFFKAFEDEVPSYLKKFFSRVIRIERLREVMVLQGFMRIDPPEPEVDTLNKMVKLQKTRDNWLPGIEVNGEGIFIEFNKKTIDEWMKLSNIEKISNNFKTLFRTYCDSRGWENAKD